MPAVDRDNTTRGAAVIGSLISAAVVAFVFVTLIRVWSEQ